MQKSILSILSVVLFVPFVLLSDDVGTPASASDGEDLERQKIPEPVVEEGIKMEEHEEVTDRQEERPAEQDNRGESVAEAEGQDGSVGDSSETQPPSVEPGEEVAVKKGGNGTIDGKESGVDELETEIASLEEFKQRKLQEEEENKKKNGHSDGRLNGLNWGKATRAKLSNYASVDCGAEVVASNEGASKSGAILQENKDAYMLNPCSAFIWFVVKLCDIVRVSTIEIANFEFFSSTPESFKVYTSERYPTEDWVLLGSFHAREERTVQSFPLEEQVYAKFIKVELVSHFGSQHYCPISLFRVLGTSMVEEYEDQETEKSAATAAASSGKGRETMLVIESPDADVDDTDWSDGLVNSLVRTVSGLSPTGIFGYLTQLFYNDSSAKTQAANKTDRPQLLQNATRPDNSTNMPGSSLNETKPSPENTTAGENKITDDEVKADSTDLVTTSADEIVIPLANMNDAKLQPGDSLEEKKQLVDDPTEEAVPVEDKPIQPDSSVSPTDADKDQQALKEDIVKVPPVDSKVQSDVEESPDEADSKPDAVNSDRYSLGREESGQRPGSNKDSDGMQSPQQQEVLSNNTLKEEEKSIIAEMVDGDVKSKPDSPTESDAASASASASGVAFDVDNSTDDAAHFSATGDDSQAASPHVNQQGNQKESVFIRLGNKIKNLEANLSLISTYLDELGYSLKKFKKNSSETLKTADKRLTELNESHIIQQEVILDRITFLVAIQSRMLEVTEEMHKEWLSTKGQLIYGLVGVCAFLLVIVFGFFLIFNRKLARMRNSPRDQEELEEAVMRILCNGTVPRQEGGDDDEDDNDEETTRRSRSPQRRLSERDSPYSVRPKDSGFIDQEPKELGPSQGAIPSDEGRFSFVGQALQSLVTAFNGTEPAAMKRKRVAVSKGLSPETRRALNQSNSVQSRLMKES